MPNLTINKSPSIMVQMVENMGQGGAMMAAPRAIVLVSVLWSPWPRRSRDVLNALAATHEQWSPDSPVEFFEMKPEQDSELNSWYENMYVSYSPRFELHGHGYGPFWWLAGGEVLEYITKPYELLLGDLQNRSVALFRDC